MCPCPDPGCADVHAHDVTATLAMEIDVREMLTLQTGDSDEH